MFNPGTRTDPYEIEAAMAAAAGGMGECLGPMTPTPMAPATRIIQKNGVVGYKTPAHFRWLLRKSSHRKLAFEELPETS